MNCPDRQVRTGAASRAGASRRTRACGGDSAGGKNDLPADAGDTLKSVLEYLKANAASKATISGFHDPSGDKAQNEELAKNRAKAVREALKAAGIEDDRIVMQKPQETTGSGDPAEARRVEVGIQP